MSDFLIIFFKKVAYLNLNLLIAVALASAIIAVGRIKNPGIRYTIWGLVAVRFFFNLFLYPEHAGVSTIQIPFPTGHPHHPPHGLLSIGFAFSSEAASLFKMLVTSVWLYDEKYTVGDILSTLLGAKVTLYLGFFMCALGIYALSRQAVLYYSFQHELKKRIVPFDFQGEKGIYTCDYINTPLVLGLVKPVVVLPHSFTGLATEEELRAIVRHERAHISRRDHLIFAALSMAEALFIPVFPLGIALRRLEEAEEQICDRMAVAAGERSRTIARALLRLAEFQAALREAGGAFPAIQTVPGFIGEKETIERRMKLLFSREKQRRITFAGALACALLYLLCFFFIFGCSVL